MMASGTIGTCASSALLDAILAVSRETVKCDPIYLIRRRGFFIQRCLHHIFILFGEKEQSSLTEICGISYLHLTAEPLVSAKHTVMVCFQLIEWVAGRVFKSAIRKNCSDMSDQY